MLDEHLTAKLADFGFSIQMPETVGNVTLINARDGLPGTNGYRPPEFSDGNYSVRSDIYSLGVVSVCLFVCACVWGGGCRWVPYGVYTRVVLIVCCVYTIGDSGVFYWDAGLLGPEDCKQLGNFNNNI